MTMTRYVRAVAALASVWVSTRVEGQTNGYVLQCLSARAAGAGCVTRARDNVPTNLFRDPAALAWFERPALEANLSAFAPSLTFQNTANSGLVDGARHVYPLGSVAYVGKKISPRVSWAVGMEPIGGFGSDFKLTHNLLGTNQDYESFFAAMKMGPAMAFEVAPEGSRWVRVRMRRMPRFATSGCHLRCRHRRRPEWVPSCRWTRTIRPCSPTC
ncbi:MAG: hypothetical protein U0163_05415 [Gemmatimonadaceae bacterium]